MIGGQRMDTRDMNEGQSAIAPSKGPEDQATADSDWIAGPGVNARPRTGLLSLVRSASRHLRAAIALLNGDNIRKALIRVRHGEFRVLAGSAFNIIALRVALREGAAPAEAEWFEPRPWTQDTPLVTIVIPCFNYGRYVKEALASVLAQTFTDLEVIVVDGGSTDGTTPDVVASLAGPRVRTLIRRDGCHLAGDNRNFGIEHAKGRYICCLDADDYLEPTYIEKMLFFLECRAFDAASCTMQAFGARKDQWRLKERPIFDDFAVGNQTLVCSLFRRALWVECSGFHDTGLGREHVAEDWDFWFRLAARGARFRNIREEALMNYRVVGDAASVSTHPEMPSFAEQRVLIHNRNKELLTSANRARSRQQAARVLRPAQPNVAMRQAMRQAAYAARRPTLLLALAHLTVGGAERLLSQVVGGLTASGWRVVVIGTEFDPPNSGSSLTWFTAHTAECYVLPRFLPPEDWRDFVDYLLGSREPDVLLIAGSRFMYGLLPDIAAQYPSMARLDLLFNTVGHIDKHMEYREVLTGALCESTTVLQWLTETAKWPEAAVRCIPSGVDIVGDIPGPRPEMLAKDLGISDDDIVVGWSGRISEEKSPETFVELVARCNDLAGVHFVMTGGGRLDDRIAGLIAQLPAGVRFHRFGLVDDIRPFYQLYDIFALTSRLDGRPLAVMEAQANGCAVIASRVGGVPEIMSDGVTGVLAAPADAADFERALRGLVADRGRLTAMKAAAANFATDHPTTAGMIEGYRDALVAAVKVASEARLTGCGGHGSRLSGCPPTLAAPSHRRSPW